MKLWILSIFFQFMILLSFSQESAYFNNIYQHANNFAVGMTILETEDGYIGYGGTEDPSNIGQMLLFFKIDKEGNEIIWKPFGEDYHSYYCGDIGGTMIKTIDGNFAVAYHALNGYSGLGYSSFIKIDDNLDTIWKKNYSTENLWTLTMNCRQTSDKGFILTGSVVPGPDEFWDALLLKTDSSGNMQWYQTYGNNLSEHGISVIETPDGGYLIGGFRYDPASPYYNTLDALVIKTDSLGNQQWLKTFGNPYVDDDMALVSMADDGNYLVTTIYGEWFVSSVSRTGRICLYKINNQGTVIEQKKMGPKMRLCHIGNITETMSGDIIASGYAYQDTIDFNLSGWLYKYTKEGDSLWLRAYNHYNQPHDNNLLYDVYPSQDNGYIAIGQAYPDMPGTSQKMWIVKVDSMGCDTAGCATGTQVFELPAESRKELLVWPNPTSGSVTLSLSKCEAKGPKTIRVFNAQGMKIDEIEIPAHTESISLDAARWNRGLYFLWVTCGDMVYSAKLVVN